MPSICFVLSYSIKVIHSTIMTALLQLKLLLPTTGTCAILAQQASCTLALFYSDQVNQIIAV